MKPAGCRAQRFVRASIAAVALALLGAACSAEKTADFQPNPSISGEFESREDALPREFPEDFPIPEGRTVLYSARSQLGLVSYFSSPLTGKALRGFFLQELPDDGWRLHSCAAGRTAPEPVWILVASKAGRVASVTVGYSPEFATRLQNARYTFFVSIAENRPAPQSTTSTCEPAPPPGPSSSKT